MDLSKHDAFRKQIAEAQAQLYQFWQVRKALDSKMEDLRQLVRANANFLPDWERRAELLCLDMMKIPTTISEAVKAALFVAGARNERLTPPQIKELAEERGFDFSGYTNPLASIHTILKRMRELNPPEVEYDESSGTYLSTSWPSGIADDERLNSRSFARLIKEDQAKAAEIAFKEVGAFFESIDRKAKNRE
jgi:hypothetical protein